MLILLTWLLVLVSPISLSMEPSLLPGLTTRAYQETVTFQLRDFINNWDDQSPCDVLEAVEGYLDQGADPNISVRGGMPLLIVIINDIHSLYPVSDAKKYKNIDDFRVFQANMVEKLLIYEANPNGFFTRGHGVNVSVLYMAITMRLPRVVKTLLDYGADPKNEPVRILLDHKKKKDYVTDPVGKEMVAIIDSFTHKIKIF
ncbi:hypothetical protein BH09DEP1_BH09DEP1_3340 [soil metagenome]